MRERSNRQRLSGVEAAESDGRARTCEIFASAPCVKEGSTPRTGRELGLPRTAHAVHNGGMISDPVLTEVQPFRVCFVCAGNICRSPMAEVVFQSMVRQAGLTRYVETSSAGTGDWHVGEQADSRTLSALARNGYDATQHRARQFNPEWFGRLDLVVALDRGHDRILKAWAPTETDRGKVALLLSFDDEQSHPTDVPDPYYAGDEMFDRVLGMIEGASRQLFRQLEPAIRQGAIR
jgi:protein-tyrosine phosphatase